MYFEDYDNMMILWLLLNQMKLLKKFFLFFLIWRYRICFLSCIKWSNLCCKPKKTTIKIILIWKKLKELKHKIYFFQHACANLINTWTNSNMGMMHVNLIANSMSQIYSMFFFVATTHDLNCCSYEPLGFYI
jgi:hypothetical protein